MNVAVYIDRAIANAINSGIILTPPRKLKIVVDICFKTGISNSRVTPPIKKLKAGNENSNAVLI